MSNQSKDIGIKVEDAEQCIDDSFVWQDYLDATNSREAPQILFPHVEQSLQSGFQEGMKVEVPLKDDPENYWVATIITACGPLLSLRYVGDVGDRSRDFWCDMTKVQLRPLGWAEIHGRPLKPPAHLKLAITQRDLDSILKCANTFSIELINSDGFTPVDRIKGGMKVEVQDEVHPYHVWVATVIENVGGRLLLRYDCPDKSNPGDFWLFYSSPRIFVINWAQSRGNSSLYFLKYYQSGHDKDIKHDFKEGMKLEAVNPLNRCEIHPATIVEVFDEHFFLVEIDEQMRCFEEKSTDRFNRLTWLATISHPYILPCGWAKKNSLEITLPTGWDENNDEEDFNWDKYLAKTNSTAAEFTRVSSTIKPPDECFEVDTKLEAVDPENHNHICVATITTIIDDLLWITLDSKPNSAKVIYHTVSHDLFPVAWCDSNNFPLKYPLNFSCSQTSVPKSQGSDDGSMTSSKYNNKMLAAVESKGSCWCPEIFFNHKCFSGPFLSKGKLAQLPKSVGPGPVTLVMKEVLSMLISIAYISSRVLRELQCKSKPKPGMHLEVLKAKYKSNAYRANVEIITSADKIDEFCREICHKLQVCPYLFGKVSVGEKSCPEKCNTLSKTRFLAKMRNNSNNNEFSPRLVKENLYDKGNVTRKKRTLERDYLSGFGQMGNNSETLTEKRTRYETRGVKLPNFGLKKQGFVGGGGYKKESSASETSSIASLPSELITNKSSKKSKSSKGTDDYETNIDLPPPLRLDSNPLQWTVEDVYDYLKGTDDCDVLANLLKEEEFDGKSFMLLNLPSCLESLKLNFDTAISLCRHIEEVKYTFFCREIYRRRVVKKPARHPSPETEVKKKVGNKWSEERKKKFSDKMKISWMNRKRLRE
ncbi:scm-like with four MBT domains protein 2 [Nilaparvata lugens]|uniref:scm-like with four MBT domains protein 2 n=1 Tax=Nilaparvata lugens TaxID=108931 RepID=UPI00193DB8CD|nr:scm-like with four MBT domains protein 2 [Nilaparvata lugens]